MSARLLLVALVCAAACQRVGGPGVNLQRMDSQPRYEPYGAGPIFPNGAAMQPPPPGTVAREDLVGAVALPAPDSALLALGQDRYHVACAPCHGAGGFGGGMVARNLPGVPGLSLQTPATRALSPAQLLARLRLPGDVRHARAAELSLAEQWAVAQYTRTLLSGRRTEAALRDSASAAEDARTRAGMMATLRHLNGAAP